MRKLMKKSINEVLELIFKSLIITLPGAVFKKSIETENNYSFYFAHIDKYGTICEEDILIIITDKEGNIIKTNIKWSPEVEKLIKLKPIEEKYVRRKIKKNMYFLYDKTKKLEDYYLTVEIDHIIYLLDENKNIIGQMIPPPFSPSLSPSPYKGITWHGCHFCSEMWNSWVYNAYDWYLKWCDSVYIKFTLFKDELTNKIKESENMIYYAIAHGTWAYAEMTPTTYITFEDVKDALISRNKYKFVFLAHCKAMNWTGDNTFAYQFAKGDMYNQYVAIGYYNMDLDPNAWTWSLEWQDKLFSYMNLNIPIYNSFESSCLDYPMVAPAVKFIGDKNVKLDLPPPLKCAITIG